MTISLRPQRLSDAHVFFTILNNPHFIYFRDPPKSLEEEQAFLKKNPEKRRKNQEYNYTILLGRKIVGGAGIRINQNRPFIGEIGYFVDEPFWRQGIATQTVHLLEQIGRKMKLVRLEILIVPENKASVKVAIKNKFKREGLLRKKLKQRGKYVDALLFAKVK